DGVTSLRPGARVEFDMVDGRRGPQVLALQLLEPVPSVSRARRAKPEEMAGMVEDLIRLLDDASNGLRQGRYPDRGHSQKIATAMRAAAAPPGPSWMRSRPTPSTSRVKRSRT